jgi:hypothetical protein
MYWPIRFSTWASVPVASDARTIAVTTLGKVRG